MFDELNSIRQRWDVFIDNFRGGKGVGGRLLVLLENKCQPIGLEGNTLIVGFHSDFSYRKISETQYRILVEEALKKTMGRTYKVRCVLLPQTNSKEDMAGRVSREVSKDVVSCNILKVSVKTNCPMGGDTGHGGLTTFILEDLAGTDIECAWDLERRRIAIKLGGDTECDTFIECLEFAAKELLRQQNENRQSYHEFVISELNNAIKDARQEKYSRMNELQDKQEVEKAEWASKYTQSQTRIAQLSAKVIELQELLAKKD